MKRELIYFYVNIFINATINTDIQKNKYHKVLAISQPEAWPSLFP